MSNPSLSQPPPRQPYRLNWKVALLVLLGFAAGFASGFGVAAYHLPRTLSSHRQPPSSPVHSVLITVENRSAVDFRNVLVNDESFGDIPAGGSSTEHTMHNMHRYAHVTLDTPSGPMDIMPGDYFAERQLSAGAYTYALRIDHGRLVMECIIDM
jgi:hypothetical protein